MSTLLFNRNSIFIDSEGYIFVFEFCETHWQVYNKHNPPIEKMLHLKKKCLHIRPFRLLRNAPLVKESTPSPTQTIFKKTSEREDSSRLVLWIRSPRPVPNHFNLRYTWGLLSTPVHDRDIRKSINSFTTYSREFKSVSNLAPLPHKSFLEQQFPQKSSHSLFFLNCRNFSVLK